MITWMQRHKKWLITTIWISTIAFVGAGFVGWGSYDFSKSGGSVAKVGSIEVQVKDVQAQYNNLYAQYKEMFGDAFNNEMAKKVNLEASAYDYAITNALLLNYANELGLGVTPTEVAKELVKIKAFIKDGKFNKAQYVKVLANNKKTPSEFEAGIKQDLLIQKLKAIINQFTASQNTELKDVQEVLFSEDKISIKVIDSQKIDIKLSNEDIKKYWEANKNNYLTSAGYEFRQYTLKAGEDLKQSKKDALRTYLQLKKEKEQFQTTKTIFENDLGFTGENIDIIRTATLGKTLKPILEGDTYYILKLVKKVTPQPLDFEKAKPQAWAHLLTSKRKDALKNNANQVLKDGKLANIGYVSRESIDKFKDLDKTEASQFLNKLFLTTDKKGIIEVGSKAIIYEVTNSKLAKYNLAKDAVVQSTINNLKSNTAMNEFIKQLKSKYEVTKYYE